MGRKCERMCLLCVCECAKLTVAFYPCPVWRYLLFLGRYIRCVGSWCGVAWQMNGYTLFSLFIFLSLSLARSPPDPSSTTPFFIFLFGHPLAPPFPSRSPPFSCSPSSLPRVSCGTVCYPGIPVGGCEYHVRSTLSDRGGMDDDGDDGDGKRPSTPTFRHAAASEHQRLSQHRWGECGLSRART